MSRIFITGSADGLGLLAAQAMIDAGHEVVAHARNGDRKEQTLKKIPGVAGIAVGDLSNMEDTKRLADEVNSLGIWDAVIHNAGIYPRHAGNEKGLPPILIVNTLAPYLLTCLIQKPKRLIYLSSDMHLSADPELKSLESIYNKNEAHISYPDTKLHDLILCKALARKWPDVFVNAVHPGWVPTKMGGEGAPDNLQKGYETQVWLAVSEDKDAKVSGQYFFHKKPARYQTAADDIKIQERFLRICEKITGIHLPR